MEIPPLTTNLKLTMKKTLYEYKTPDKCKLIFMKQKNKLTLI